MIDAIQDRTDILTAYEQEKYASNIMQIFIKMCTHFLYDKQENVHLPI